MRELYVRNRYCLNKALAAVEHGSKVSVYVPHIYSGLQLVQRNPAAVAQHLSADVLTDGSGSYSRKHARIFKLSLALVHRLLSGGVRVQVSSLVLDLQLQLRSLPGALRHSYRCDAFYTIVLISRHTRTLKAMCSRKWAVPLLCSFSYRLPASIHRPTCIM